MTTSESPSRPEDFVTVNPGLRIPASELRFTAARSGGPGGQHVNTTSTKVTLIFDLAASPSLTEDQRRTVFAKLAGRINQAGELRITASEFRSQAGNKAAAVLRFAELLRQALTPRAKRRRTKPTLASRLKRLEAKRLRGGLKRQRGKPPET